MKRKTRISNQPEHQYGLILGLAGVMSVMSLFLPTPRAGPEGISTAHLPVATVGESRSAEHAPSLLEPDQATAMRMGEANRQGPQSLEVKLGRTDPPGKVNLPSHLITTKRPTRRIGKGSANKVIRKDSEANGAILSVPQARAIRYRYDDLNRLIEVIYEDGTRITYTYDAAGNLMRTIAEPR